MWGLSSSPRGQESRAPLTESARHPRVCFLDGKIFNNANGEKDASLDDILPCVFTELRKHAGNLEL